MRRIIIAAILTVICAVGAGTSFAVNDLPNFGEWMKTNEQQFRKPHRHDGPNMHMDKHMMDGNNQMMPQGGMGPNNGGHMHSNGQMSPQGQPPQGQPPQGSQPNGNAPQQAPNGETQAQ
ncbi:transcriptional regulator [Veillonella infantium]|uniref:Transcriptional regulator n=1 Tax=Veillonella infantium TaxID=1911679 RepID=A0ABX5C4T1_9FIRM|nr:transcriptional regulator [Veillonella infantium]PQL58346.1 transcriptional regulator [Veillonella infantium]